MQASLSQRQLASRSRGLVERTTPVVHCGHFSAPAYVPNSVASEQRAHAQSKNLLSFRWSRRFMVPCTKRMLFVSGEHTHCTQIRAQGSRYQPLEEYLALHCSSCQNELSTVTSKLICSFTNKFIYTMSTVTSAENSTEILIILYISFRTLSFPCFLPHFLPVLHIIG